MSVVVTGATGQLGRLVVKPCSRRALPADRDRRRRPPTAWRSPDGVRTAAIDYDAPATLEAAFEGAERCCSSRAPRWASASRSTARHRRRQGRRRPRLVYTSAPNADTTRAGPRAEHRATEEVIAGSGLPCTFLRNSWYTENYVGAVAAGALHRRPARPAPATVASPAPPRDDFAAGAAAVLLGGDHDGRVYELTGDVAWSADESPRRRRPSWACPSSPGRSPPTSTARSSSTPVSTRAPRASSRRSTPTSAAATWPTRPRDLRTLIGRPTTPLVDGLRAALGQ